MGSTPLAPLPEAVHGLPWSGETLAPSQGFEELRVLGREAAHLFGQLAVSCGLLEQILFVGPQLPLPFLQGRQAIGSEQKNARGSDCGNAQSTP